MYGLSAVSYTHLDVYKRQKEQLQARDKIIERVKMALSIGAAGQLIFVEGEAGTGKTVLNSSTFYEICCLAEENGLDDLRCNLIINPVSYTHLDVYKRQVWNSS